jgi:hypothetical protein
MALMATLITRDLTGAIGIGLTGTGVTIEKVPSGSLFPRPQRQSILVYRLLNPLSFAAGQLAVFSRRERSAQGDAAEESASPKTGSCIAIVSDNHYQFGRRAIRR